MNKLLIFITIPVLWFSAQAEASIIGGVDFPSGISSFADSARRLG